MNTQALEDAIVAMKLDPRTLSHCADMARVLVESRTLRENMRGDIARMGYPSEPVARSIHDEARVRAATLIVLAERVLSGVGIDCGRSTDDASDAVVAIERASWRT